MQMREEKLSYMKRERESMEEKRKEEKNEIKVSMKMILTTI